MELEQRVEILEREIDVLKGEIQQTLLAVQANLSDKPESRSRWRRRAWVLALLNILLSITLFTNIRFYTSDTPSGVGPALVPWLRGFWVALAFVWLLLQMYPLALLLDQEEGQSREVAWRNAAAFFASNPGLTLALTVVVLVTAVISALFPSFWFVTIVVLVAVVGVNEAVRWLRLYKQRT